MSNILRRVIDSAGQFIFNLRNAYYEGEDGSAVDLQTTLDNRVQDVIALAQSLTDSLVAGDTSVGEWRQSFAVELRRAYSQAFALGRGGWSQVTQDDRATISAMLKSEFGYLAEFARAIQSGELSEAQIANRMEMYANGLQKAFWEGDREAKIDAGYSQERRILNAKESCPDCVEYADQGWVEIGTLPAPGVDSQCLSNCACEFDYQ